MRRVAALLGFVLVLWAAVPAQAQFSAECRYGFCSTEDLSVAPISNACSVSSGTTITFTAQGVGGPNPNRISVVSINWADTTAAGTASITAVTIGGISMSRAVRALGASQNSNSEIWFVANPTGTTANIVITAATAINATTIGVYSLVGYLASPVAATTGTTSVSQVYTNKQLAIGAGSRTVNVSTSLSNMVNDFSSACGTGLWGVHASQKLSGNGTLTSAISPSTNSPEIALAVWSQQAASCTQSVAFLARTSGLDATHTAAYGNLICGLVTDGVFSKFDFLYIYATQNSTTALLNLISASFNGTVHGAPTFTTDRGYAGVAASTTVYIDTGFNPITATTPQFTQNSAHLSLWNLTNATSANPGIGSQSSSVNTLIYAKYIDNSTYYRPNIGVTGGAGGGFADPRMHIIANRSTSTAIQEYINGSNQAATSIASVTPFNGNFYTIGTNNNSVALGDANQSAALSVGSSLSATDAANFYNRLRTYMTAVGVP